MTPIGELVSAWRLQATPIGAKLAHSDAGSGTGVGGASLVDANYGTGVVERHRSYV